MFKGAGNPNSVSSQFLSLSVSCFFGFPESAHSLKNVLGVQLRLSEYLSLSVQLFIRFSQVTYFLKCEWYPIAVILFCTFSCQKYVLNKVPRIAFRGPVTMAFRGSLLQKCTNLLNYNKYWV
jgi:hypothetical protein